MIEIRKVKTKKEQRDFVNFPLKLYKNCEFFAPPLYADEMKMFKKNYVYYDQSISVFFNAYENGKIVADTKIGEYMYNVFKFNIRPTGIIWKINKLRELKEILKNDTSEKGRELYQAIDIQLEKLLTDMVFKNKE